MIFLTGSTGFLGRELVHRLLSTDQSTRLCLLARGKSQSHAEMKVYSALSDCLSSRQLESAKSRIEVVRGDLESERFGLGLDTYERITRDLTAVFHSAATTNLDFPLEKARAINVGGTKNAVALAQAGNAVAKPGYRLHHISTAYVAGNTQRVVSADELCFRDGFRNSYERSKAESEAIVREAQNNQLPATIYRPSVIVGDSKTGKTSAFNVLYLPAKMLIKGICKTLPAFPETPFDVVPVNYVADAIIHLSRNPQAVGACYHLSAGVGRESSPIEIIDSLLKTFDLYRKSRPKHLRASPLFVAPELLSLAFSSISALKILEKKVTSHINVFSQLLPLVPYMLNNPQFDTKETVRDLDSVMDIPPLFPQYAEIVFRYCFDTNWGRSPLPT